MYAVFSFISVVFQDSLLLTSATVAVKHLLFLLVNKYAPVVKKNVICSMIAYAWCICKYSSQCLFIFDTSLPSMYLSNNYVLTTKCGDIVLA